MGREVELGISLSPLCESVLIWVSKVVYGAKRKALGIGCFSEQVRPELVFIVGARPHIPEQPELQPQSRSKDDTGIVRVRGVAHHEVHAAKLDQILGLKAQVAVVTPGINRTVPCCILNSWMARPHDSS